MQRINPRHLLRDTIKALEDSRCPECGRAFDAEAAMEDYCPRIVPLHCDWCYNRAAMMSRYSVWLQQDSAVSERYVRERVVSYMRNHG